MAEKAQHPVAEPPDPPADESRSESVALGVEDVMEWLSLSRAQVYRLVKDGVLKAGKSDAQLTFNECDVAAAAAQHAERRERANALLRLIGAILAEYGIDDFPEVGAEDYEAVVNEAANGLLLAGMAAQSTDLYVMPCEDGDRLLMRLGGNLQEVARVDCELGGQLRERLQALAPLPEPDFGQGNAAVFKHSSHCLSAVVRICVTPTPAGDHLHLQLFISVGERTLASVGFTTKQSEVLQGLLSGKPGLFVLAGSHTRILQEQRLALANYLDSLGKLVVSIDRMPNYISENIVYLEGRRADEADGADPWQTAMSLCPDAIMLGKIEGSDQVGCLTAALAAGIAILVQVQRATGAAALKEITELGFSHCDLSRYFRAACEFTAIPRLCPDCRAPRTMLAEEAEMLEEHATAQLYIAVGCEQCQAGYRGNLSVWGLLCDSDLEGTRSPDGEAPLTRSGGKPLSGDTSLAAALRCAALAGDATFSHIEPFLR